MSVSLDEASLSSPEVLRRLECSEDRLPERFHASALGSRLSEISALNSTCLDLPHVKTSPRVVMEPPHSRTITPDPAPRSTNSPGSVSVSDNFSMLDSLDTDRVCGLTLAYMLPFRAFCKELLVFGLDVVKYLFILFF